MMNDMQIIRDEWLIALQDKEQELKRAEADFAARADRIIEECQN